MKPFKIGEKIVVVVNMYPYYRRGDVGCVVENDKHLNPLVNFNDLGNAEVCGDGVWRCHRNHLEAKIPNTEFVI